MIAAGDTRSRSAMDCWTWLEGEQLADDERAFWLYLAVQAKRYPVPFIPPFTKPKGPGRVRRLIGACIRTRNDASGCAVPRLLQLYDGTSDRAVDVDHGALGADAFADAALTKSSRSCFIVFPHGGRRDIRLIVQQWGRRLIELGFTIDVLMGGGLLKALIVKKGRHRWYLVCWETMTGVPSRKIESYARLTTGWHLATHSDAGTVYRAATYVQDTVRSWFGLGLSLTISNTGLRAAARSLPDHVAKFRPLPMLVAMSREGAGFRGGLVRGHRYRGPTWLVDLNRAYTAALRHPLPWRAVFDRCDRGGVERHGMYMCRVTGRPGLPQIYVGRWTGNDVDVAWYHDPDGVGFLCVLPTAEIDGIRALGYDVRPGWGMVYVRTFSLAEFVQRIVSVCRAYGWQSPEAKLTKLLGNSIYGKFAALPERRDLRVAARRPGRDWLTFVDETGYPVDDMWERLKTVYQWSQHVDVAADVTATVRSQMYEAQAATQRAGGQVVAMSTDALVVTVEPDDILAVHGTDIGRWKQADADADGIVAGPNAYAIGSKVIVPDYPNPAREAVVGLYVDSFTVADAERSGAPRPGAPLSWKVRRTITLGYAATQTTTDWLSAVHRPSGSSP